MTAQCDICGSRFATKKCYFCEGKICTSCIVPADAAGNYTTTKCINCNRQRISKISIFSVLRRNKTIIGILVGFWIFTVYPIPFLQMTGYKLDASVFQPILITTGVMSIPFVFMFIAWQKRAPRDSRRSDRYNY